MSVVKKQANSNWRQLLQVPVVLIGVFIAYAMWSGRIGAAPGILLFILTIICSISLSFWIMKSYKCPQCAQPTIPATGWWWRFSGRKILFRCANCDIDWDFAVRGQED